MQLNLGNKSYNLRTDTYQVSHPSLKIDNYYVPCVYSNTTGEWARPVSGGSPFGYYYYQASGLKVDSNLRLAQNVRRYIRSYSGSMSITLTGTKRHQETRHNYPAKSSSVVVQTNVKDAPWYQWSTHYSDRYSWGFTYYRIDSVGIVDGTSLSYSYDNSNVWCWIGYYRGPYFPANITYYTRINSSGVIDEPYLIWVSDINTESGTASTWVSFGVTFNSVPVIRDLTAGFYASDVSTTGVRINRYVSKDLSYDESYTFNLRFSFSVNEIL